MLKEQSGDWLIIFGTAKETDTGTVQHFICSSDARRDTVPMMTALRGYDGLKFHTACKMGIWEFGEIYPDWAKQGKNASRIPVTSVLAESRFLLQNRAARKHLYLW